MEEKDLIKSTKVIMMIFAGAVTCSISWANDNVSTMQDQSIVVHNSLIEGPFGVSRQLEEDENINEKRPRLLPLKFITDWKDQLKEEYGLLLAAHAIMLYQNVGETLPEHEYDAASTILWFQGNWAAFERDDGHFGRLEWRVEKRFAIAGLQSPSELKDAMGVASFNTGYGYNDTFDTDISVLNWSQGFKNRVSIAVGRLAFDAHLDAFAFQTFFRAFLNSAFVVNPTIATTGVGALGIVAKGFVTDNILIGAHIYDANAIGGEFDINTFKQHEWLTAIEIAWAPSIENYKIDRIQFTYWYKDERQEAGVEEGSGWAVSASHQWNEELIPFIRFGHSDGGAGVAAESSASVGFEYTPREYHAWSLGAGWAKPSEKTHGAELSNEYAFESSYKFQASRNISLMPNVQLILNPAKNPNVNRDWILGVQCILSL